MWMRWWQGVFVIGGGLIASPAFAWWENRKIAKALASRGLPRADAPGRLSIAEPTAGCEEGIVVGRIESDDVHRTRAVGPCCDNPDWIEAFQVRDEDRVPCCACGKGLMTVSDHAIH
jgi:hypothetical protein